MKRTGQVRQICREVAKGKLPQSVFESDFNHERQINESRYFVRKVLERGRSKWEDGGFLRTAYMF
ncbi:hypothetical protein SAMN00808754_1470 [Thermanaeromonas toyohensis ToBE]|uniref:Uncharacterized protein n=1 Tax=Thermanaeromonas toyohensis ToBE TaxID=698762 RepID=A0A1W1VSR7_9FIRM|nr:hypothetical protein SAMN00808754_1470 [Thermanaeromonas toyohensis ToBE]